MSSSEFHTTSQRPACIALYDPHSQQLEAPVQLSGSSGKNSRYFHTQKGMKQTHKGMKNHCFSRKHVFHTLKRHFIPV
jgi:hypothetical protein